MSLHPDLAPLPFADVPQFILDRVEAIRTYPRCCWTCDFVARDGVCGRYKAVPPEAFAAQSPTSCPHFLERLPF